MHRSVRGAHPAHGGVVNARHRAAYRHLGVALVTVAEQRLDRVVAEPAGRGCADIERAGELEELDRRPVHHQETRRLVDDHHWVRHRVDDRGQLLLAVGRPAVELG